MKHFCSGYWKKKLLRVITVFSHAHGTARRKKQCWQKMGCAWIFGVFQFSVLLILIFQSFDLSKPLTLVKLSVDSKKTLTCNFLWREFCALWPSKEEFTISVPEKYRFQGSLEELIGWVNLGGNWPTRTWLSSRGICANNKQVDYINNVGIMAMLPGEERRISQSPGFRLFSPREWSPLAQAEFRI